MPPSPGLSGPGKGGGRGGGTVLGDLEGCVGWYLSSPGSHPSRVSYPGRASARTPSLAPGAQAPLGPPGPRPGPGPARRGRTAPSSLLPAPPPLPLMTGRIKFFSTRDSGGGGLGPLVTSLRLGRRKDGLREPPRGPDLAEPDDPTRASRSERTLRVGHRAPRPGPVRPSLPAVHLTVGRFRLGEPPPYCSESRHATESLQGPESLQGSVSLQGSESLRVASQHPSVPASLDAIRYDTMHNVKN